MFSRIVRGFVLSLAALAAWGQSFSGNILGLVSDESAAAIPNVSVTVVNQGTGAHRNVTSDADGVYVVAALPVGYYTLTYEARGLSKVERQKVKVDVGGDTRVDVML